MTKPLTNLNIFRNLEFSRFRCHVTVCLVTYNFFVSKRQTAILSGNKIHTYRNGLAYKLFRDSLFWSKKIDREDRKRIDCTRSIRQAIAAADAISLRCNHSTRHVRPAVNRQPGYRRVDSQSGHQQTQKNLKTNSKHKDTKQLNH